MMKTRTKLDVKSQRPKRYIMRDAVERKMLSANASFTARTAGARARRGELGRTDAEEEEEEQRYGVGAQAPVQVALLRLLGSIFHCCKNG